MQGSQPSPVLAKLPAVHLYLPLSPYLGDKERFVSLVTECVDITEVKDFVLKYGATALGSTSDGGSVRLAAARESGRSSSQRNAWTEARRWIHLSSA